MKKRVDYLKKSYKISQNALYLLEKSILALSENSEYTAGELKFIKDIVLFNDKINSELSEKQ